MLCEEQAEARQTRSGADWEYGQEDAQCTCSLWLGVDLMRGPRLSRRWEFTLLQCPQWS